MTETTEKQTVPAHHFRIRKHNAVLRDVNPRKEKYGDKRKLAADLGLEIDMPFGILNELTSADIPWETFCWNDKEDARLMWIKHFALEVEYEDHFVTITVGGDEMVFEGANLRKFTAVHKDGKRVKLCLQAQVYCNKKQSGILCDAIMETVSVKVEPRQLELVKTGN